MDEIAFLVPTTTRSRDWKKIEDTYLYTTLLSSLDVSCPHFNITVYLGYDRDDPIYSIQENRSVISSENYSIKWVPNEPDPGNVVAVWNTLSQEALKDGFEYMMVLGDDIIIPKDRDWLTVFMKQLKKNKNIGWVGGWSNNDDIATQFLIHKTHLDIFGWVFPPQIKNWYCDNFINDVYPNKYCSWLKQYKVMNVGGTPRYMPLDDKKLCAMLVRRHKSAITRFLNQQYQ